MNIALDNRGSEFSWTSSVLAHFLLLAILAMQTTAPLPKPKILTVETVAGMITPRGEGAGAVGQGKTITDKALASPLAQAFNMDLSAIKAPAPVKPAPVKPQAVIPAKPKNPPLAAKPDLVKERADTAFPDIRNRPSDDTAVEGLGGGTRAGTSKGAPQLSGAIAGRGWRGPADWKYNKNIPEETSLLVQVVVRPNGFLSSVTIAKTSGFREIDEYYLTKIREMIFDSLPAGVEQLDEIGEIPIRLKYKE